jgi:hypothetical protein
MVSIDGDADALGLTDGLTDGEILGDIDGEVEGEIDGETDRDSEGETLADCATDGLALPDGEIEGLSRNRSSTSSTY